MGAVTPETCRVVLQWINICILLHLLDFIHIEKSPGKQAFLKIVGTRNNELYVYSFNDIITNWLNLIIPNNEISFMLFY